MRFTRLLIFIIVLYCCACNTSKQDSSAEYQFQTANAIAKALIEVRLNSLIKIAHTEARLKQFIAPEIIVDSLIDDYIAKLEMDVTYLQYNALCLFKRKIINVYYSGSERSQLIDSTINNYKQVDTDFSVAEATNQLLNLELQIVNNKYRRVTYCGWEYYEQAIDLGDGHYICIIRNNVDLHDSNKMDVLVEVSKNNQFLPNHSYAIERLYHMFVVHLYLHDIPVVSNDIIRVFLEITPENAACGKFLQFFTLNPYLDRASL